MTLQIQMKKKTLFRLLLLSLLLFPHHQGTAQAMSNMLAIPGQIIVQLQPGVTIDAINQTYNTVTLTELAPGGGAYLLQAPEGRDIDVLLASMRADPRLVYAELNLIAESPEAVRSNNWKWGGEDAEPYAGQYALDSINFAGAHAYSTGSGIVVAVVDTGVQLSHPELAGHLTTVQADFIDGDAIANDEPNGLDEDGDGEVDEGTGHGTHVAGIVHLVAPDAQIMPVRVLDSDGLSDAFTVAEGILFAVENGANVINLSLGTSEESELLEDAIEEATENGVVVIAAAGNLGTTQEVYPAADECALAVTSVGPTDLRSSDASYGTWVDLAAPGESIYSSFPVDGYAWWSGTSMAAPFATGQSALLLGYDPSLNVIDVANLMGGSARSIDLINQLRRPLLGAGKIDVSASLAALAEGAIPNGPELIDDDCLSGDSEVQVPIGICQGFLGAIAVDNLEVPQGSSCTLYGTQIKGNIKVGNGASLTAHQITVHGNIQAEGAHLVEVLASSIVGGSIQLKKGGLSRVENVVVSHDIQFELNHGVSSIVGNQVGGNIQVFKNGGGVTIATNTVDGNLQCKENSPAPVGWNNTVQGNKEDQCVML